MLSHRSTTSSRHPGVTFNGVVSVDAVPLVKCAKCGGLRRHSFHAHAPRWLQLTPAKWVRVDCSGREVAT